jgi:hypothetical protein
MCGHAKAWAVTKAGDEYLVISMRNFGGVAMRRGGQAEQQAQDYCRKLEASGLTRAVPDGTGWYRPAPEPI